MSSKENNNPYTVCIIFDKKDRSFDDFMQEFTKLSEEENDILFIRSCRKNVDQDKDQGYIACIKKYINDKYSKDEEFIADKGIVIKRCHPNNEPLRNNMTWGFFIKTDKVDPQYVISLFLSFESSGFLKKDSYQIVFPRTYPNGDSRNYLIVTFEKSNGSYPRKFIKKLKILLNDSPCGENLLKINWLSNSVMKDILQGENKDFVKKEEAVLEEVQAEIA
jgi:hypothetical protein